MKEEEDYRNDWAMGRIAKAIKSEDGKVRKVFVSIMRAGKKKIMLRPIKQLILLVPVDDSKATKAIKNE